MSDAWEEIQAVKSKRNSLREKLEKRKKNLQTILSSASLGETAESSGSGNSAPAASSPKSECKYIFTNIDT